MVLKDGRNIHNCATDSYTLEGAKLCSTTILLSVHFLHCHFSCNKHWFIVCTGIYPVLGHWGSQRHLIHSVVLHRWSWERSLLTTTGSPRSVWTNFHISYNHSTGLRQLMQALLYVDSRHPIKWTAKSLQQEKAGGGVPSTWRWEDGMVYVHT